MNLPDTTPPDKDIFELLSEHAGFELQVQPIDEQMNSDAILKDAKGQELPTDIVALAGNYPSMRMILIWQFVTLERNDNAPDLPNGTPRWQKLWNGVTYDKDEIADLADIPRSVVQKHIKQAQVLGWIYPDGTVHRYAKELALSSLVKRAGATAKKKPDEKKE